MTGTVPIARCDPFNSGYAAFRRPAGRGHPVNDDSVQRSWTPSSTASLADTSGDRERLAAFLGADRHPRHAARLLPYIGSTVAVAVTLACGILIERFVGLQSVLLVFL